MSLRSCKFSGHVLLRKATLVAEPLGEKELSTQDRCEGLGTVFPLTPQTPMPTPSQALPEVLGEMVCASARCRATGLFANRIAGILVSSGLSVQSMFLSAPCFPTQELGNYPGT